MDKALIIETVKELEMPLALDYLIDIFEVDIPNDHDRELKVITPLRLIREAKTFEEAEVALNNFIEGLNS